MIKLSVGTILSLTCQIMNIQLLDFRYVLMYFIHYVPFAFIICIVV